MRKTILSTAVVAALATSNAQACCGDGEVAAAGAKWAAAGIVTAIETSTITLASWLERLNMTIAAGFGKVSAELMKQTAAQRVMHQGMIATQAKSDLDKREAEAALKFKDSPRSCYEVSSGTSAGIAAGKVAATQTSLCADSARRTLFTANTAAAVAGIYDEHVSKYCSQQDAALGRCQVATPDMQNADVRADVALNSSSYTPEQIAAARAFVNNVTNPFPTQNIPQSWEKTAQGKTFVAGQYIEQARASVVANSFNAAIAERIPIQGLGTRAQVSKADISELELMESQVYGRFASKEWYTMLAGFGVEQLLREIAKIDAYQLWTGLKDYRQNERIEQVLATQLAIAVKLDSEQRLREARRAAGDKQ